MLKQGCWWLRSKKDPRWNRDGGGYVGMFAMNPAQKELLELLEKAYGSPPDDLEWGYMKD